MRGAKSNVDQLSIGFVPTVPLPKVADRLPIMLLRPHMPKLLPVGGGSKNPSVVIGSTALDAEDGNGQSQDEDAELEWVLEVELSRRGITSQRGAGRARVYAPHFPKVGQAWNSGSALQNLLC